LGSFKTFSNLVFFFDDDDLHDRVMGRKREDDGEFQTKGQNLKNFFDEMMLCTAHKLGKQIQPGRWRRS